MTTTSDETQNPEIEQQGARKMSRRSVLTWIGIGAGTAALAAGTGIGVRAASNGAFTAGLGTPYALWRDWAALSGVERVVAAGVLACNPHNTQPWRLGVSSEVGEHSKIVIVETEEQTVGVIVDAVDEVLTVEDDQLEEIPGADTTLMDSIAKLDDRLVVLLNPNTTFCATPLAA